MVACATRETVQKTGLFAENLGSRAEAPSWLHWKCEFLMMPGTPQICS